MKKLNSLNLGKSLNREEMKSISAGLLNANDPYCTCGTKPAKLTHCDCDDFCNLTCTQTGA